MTGERREVVPAGQRLDVGKTRESPAQSRRVNELREPRAEGWDDDEEDEMERNLTQRPRDKGKQREMAPTPPSKNKGKQKQMQRSPQPALPSSDPNALRSFVVPDSDADDDDGDYDPLYVARSLPRRPAPLTVKGSDDEDDDIPLDQLVTRSQGPLVDVSATSRASSTYRTRCTSTVSTKSDGIIDSSDFTARRSRRLQLRSPLFQPRRPSYGADVDVKWRTIDDNEKLEYWQKRELPKLKVADNDMTILWRKQRERKQEEERMRREAIGEMTEDTGGESAEDEEEIKEREMLEEQERLKNFKEELQELEEQRATIPILFEGDWATGTQEQMRKLLLANNQLYHGLYDEEDKHIPLRTENRTAIDEDETSGTETDGE